MRKSFSIIAIVITVVGGLQAMLIAGQGGAIAAECPNEPQKFYPCALGKAKTFDPPRTPDGKPDFQGYWNRGANNIEAHPDGSPRGVPGADVAGPTLIVDPADGLVPYQPWALKQRDYNVKTYISPKTSCFLPGVPLHQYTGGGYRIVQSPDSMMIVTESYTAYRVIPSDGRPHLGKNIELWQGDSRGHWEGNTFVVDVTNVNARNWLDRAGNFYSAGARLVERWTLADINTILYEVTIEDPKVYTRPWKMAFGIRRITEPGYEIYAEECHEGNKLEGLTSIGMKFYRGVVPPN